MGRTPGVLLRFAHGAAHYPRPTPASQTLKGLFFTTLSVFHKLAVRARM